MSNTVLSASPVFIYVINLLLTGTDTEISGVISGQALKQPALFLSGAGRGQEWGEKLLTSSLNISGLLSSFNRHAVFEIHKKPNNKEGGKTEDGHQAQE